MNGYPQYSRLFDDLEILARSDREKKEMTEGFAPSPYRLNGDVKDAERRTEDGGRRTPCAPGHSDSPPLLSTTGPLQRRTSVRRRSSVNRPVTAYEYGDASETVTDWADLLPKVLGILLQQNRAALLDLAK